MALVSLARAFIELAGEATLGAVMHPANGRFGSINVVSSASLALPLLPIPDVSLRRIARRLNRLTRDEAGRMTVNFAKLPELLRRSPPMSEA